MLCQKHLSGGYVTIDETQLIVCAYPLSDFFNKKAIKLIKLAQKLPITLIV